MTRVGSDLKQKIIDSVKNTWRTINDFAYYRRPAGTEATTADGATATAANDDISGGEVDIDNVISDSASYYSETIGRLLL